MLGLHATRVNRKDQRIEIVREERGTGKPVLTLRRGRKGDKKVKC